MPTLTHKFTVKVAPFGREPEVTEFNDLPAAIQHWDRRAFELAHEVPSARYEGGIEVRSYMPLKEARQNLKPGTLTRFKVTDDPETPVCVRNGWVLHLFDGHTYLSPTLQLG